MCTGIRITAENGDVFWGRTMDLNIPMFGTPAGLPAALDNVVVISTVPAGAEMPSPLAAWKSKYATMGVGIKGTNILLDGINEKGLAGDTQVLMECTRGAASDIAARKQTGVLGEEFVSFILSQFGSVAEIRERYADFALLDQPYDAFGQHISMPLHYCFVDTTGDGIVLEPVEDGAFKLYDYAGAYTNSPEYDWHLINVGNYITLNNVDPAAARKLPTGLELQPIEGGTGYGMFGLPGDYTAPSRMVRALNLAAYLKPFDREQGIAQLYAAFRTVIIPPGLEHKGDVSSWSDYSRYWAGYDLSERTVYVQTGEGLAITAKKLDTTVTETTYDAIDLSNNVHALN
ncbi:linear amide C-N hydrolase [Gordonia sp. (in: high G+C Gram-positive bacteria)]|uniref:linear amide C-N hydrolase n=1 Tax=Gordonia sp. (in: high G+C Gram-positive bacteria) TaxID=84139 RepID=UPI0016A9D787|nr:linear amide C-N hydrolase [Gordonia sp. (in: high G+C Gram-positive bacteria)]NLG45313.1 linear amide C-N hydrolase [Gordonia sp. (in: high G+C Gram-positive bacteria)]